MNPSITDSHIHPHLIEQVRDWPINKISTKRESFVLESSRQTREEIYKKFDNLEDLLGKCMLQEVNRIKHNPWKVDPPNEKLFWRRIQNQLAELPENEKQRTDRLQELLQRVIRRYAEEIVGDFKPKTFLLARKVLTILFKILFDRFFTGTWAFWGSRKTLMRRIRTIGPIEHVRELMKIGQVILVPTHSSNLDSIYIGYAVDAKTGMPAFVYGAGLNLYNAEIMAYYMNRLGTYRVDRRKKNAIYLETLKSVSRQSTLEGINQLFFPGGTRSRSGKIEQNLKLGLLNTAVEAQRVFLGREQNQKVFIVPVVISYSNVLEGRQLINQYLRQAGREKYITKRGKIPWYKWMPSFIKDLLFARTTNYVSFGAPMDVIGNKVDLKGESSDDNGNPVQIRDYFISDQNVVNEDIQRESIYTKRLGERIAQHYLMANPVHPGQVMAYVAFELLSKKHKSSDFFDLFKLNFEDTKLNAQVVEEYFKVIMDQLIELHEEGRLILTFDKPDDFQKFLQGAVKEVGRYHYYKPMVINKDGGLSSEDVPLLYYYRNRLNTYME